MIQSLNEAIRPVLLAGMAGLLLARHVVADQEALDGAVAEAQPAPGKQAAQLIDGDVGGLGDQPKNQRKGRVERDSAGGYSIAGT